MAVTVPKRAWGQRSFLPPPPREGWTIEVRGHCFQEDRPKDRRVDVPCPTHRKEDMESRDCDHRSTRSG